MNIKRLTFAVNDCAASAIRPALIVLTPEGMRTLLGELEAIRFAPDAQEITGASRFLGIPLVEAGVEFPLLLLPDGSTLAIA